MKKYFYLLIIIFSLISCETDDDLTSSSYENNLDVNSDLFGQWNWVSNNDEFNGIINQTPSSTGKTILLTLKRNYCYLITINNQKKYSGTYELSIKESVFSEEKERFISLQISDDQYDEFITYGIINIIQNDILLISNNNIHGIVSKFTNY